MKKRTLAALLGTLTALSSVAPTMVQAAENTEEYTVTFFRSYREVYTDLCWNYTDHFDLSICTEIFCKGCYDWFRKGLTVRTKGMVNPYG